MLNIPPPQTIKRDLHGPTAALLLNTEVDSQFVFSSANLYLQAILTFMFAKYSAGTPVEDNLGDKTISA
jgi:hypothetical protein